MHYIGKNGAIIPVLRRETDAQGPELYWTFAQVADALEEKRYDYFRK